MNQITEATYAFGEPHIFVNGVPTVEQVVASSAFSVVTLAHKTDILD